MSGAFVTRRLVLDDIPWRLKSLIGNLRLGQHHEKCKQCADSFPKVEKLMSSIDRRIRIEPPSVDFIEIDKYV